MAIEIRTEYAIVCMGKVCGYVIKRDDPMNYWIDKDFGATVDWVVFKKMIPLNQAVREGIVQPVPTGADHAAD